MSTFEKLNEEDVNIIVSDRHNDINIIQIILRNLKNENTKYTFDKRKVKTVSQLKSDVNTF
jgi:hypothetical protein